MRVYYVCKHMCLFRRVYMYVFAQMLCSCCIHYVHICTADCLHVFVCICMISVQMLAIPVHSGMCILDPVATCISWCSSHGTLTYCNTKMVNELVVSFLLLIVFQEYRDSFMKQWSLQFKNLTAKEETIYNNKWIKASGYTGLQGGPKKM